MPKKNHRLPRLAGKHLNAVHDLSAYSYHNMAMKDI